MRHGNSSRQGRTPLRQGHVNPLVTRVRRFPAHNHRRLTLRPTPSIWCWTISPPRPVRRWWTGLARRTADGCGGDSRSITRQNTAAGWIRRRSKSDSSAGSASASEESKTSTLSPKKRTPGTSASTVNKPKSIGRSQEKPDENSNTQSRGQGTRRLRLVGVDLHAGGRFVHVVPREQGRQLLVQSWRGACCRGAAGISDHLEWVSGFHAG